MFDSVPISLLARYLFRSYNVFILNIFGFYFVQISGQWSDCGGVTFPERSKDQNESEFVNSRKLHLLRVKPMLYKHKTEILKGALQMNFVCLLYDPNLTHLRIDRSFCYSMMPN